MDFDVLSICTAYEQGFGHGLEHRGLPNPYALGSKGSEAWAYGYEMGQEKSETKPNHNRKYFYYDLCQAEYESFNTEIERDQAAAAQIANYLDDGWDDQVEHIVAGVVTHNTKQTDLLKRPPEDEIDEEGCDGEGEYWGDATAKCNYVLKEF